MTARCACDPAPLRKGCIPIEYRVEKKYIVSDQDLTLLRARLSCAMAQDAHQTGESYPIRSLYFDTFDDAGMDENESGVDLRRKFRIRHYNPASEAMRLEIKDKVHGYTKKTSCPLSRAECTAIMAGSTPAAFGSRAPLNALRIQMLTNLMRPKAIIEYERTAFVHPTGNVRITFDRNIAASKATEDFLSPSVRGFVPLLPAGMHVLEVKYDELLPDHIAQLLELGNLQQCAFSKYYLGRMAILGRFPLPGC